MRFNPFFYILLFYRHFKNFYTKSSLGFFIKYLVITLLYLSFLDNFTIYDPIKSVLVMDNSDVSFRYRNMFFFGCILDWISTYGISEDSIEFFSKVESKLNMSGFEIILYTCLNTVSTIFSICGGFMCLLSNFKKAKSLKNTNKIFVGKKKFNYFKLGLLLIYLGLLLFPLPLIYNLPTIYYYYGSL